VALVKLIVKYSATGHVNFDLRPVFLLGLVVVTVQHLLVHFFFLQRLGRNLVLALDNRYGTG